jgi:PIN domain nuclease of toxin-antitoxin system
LLDTSTLIWAVHAPEHLSAHARNICTGRQMAPAVSVVSLMELIVKVQKQKLVLHPDPIQWWNHYIAQLGFSVLPLRQPHVERLWTLPLLHRDPADRLLIAQAIAEQIPLVTSDAAVRQYPVQAIW